MPAVLNLGHAGWHHSDSVTVTGGSAGPEFGVFREVRTAPPFTVPEQGVFKNFYLLCRDYCLVFGEW